MKTPASEATTSADSTDRNAMAATTAAMAATFPRMPTAGEMADSPRLPTKSVGMPAPVDRAVKKST